MDFVISDEKHKDRSTERDIEN